MSSTDIVMRGIVSVHRRTSMLTFSASFEANTPQNGAGDKPPSCFDVKGDCTWKTSLSFSPFAEPSKPTSHVTRHGKYGCNALGRFLSFSAPAVLSFAAPAAARLRVGRVGGLAAESLSFVGAESSGLAAARAALESSSAQGTKMSFSGGHFLTQRVCQTIGVVACARVLQPCTMILYEGYGMERGAGVFRELDTKLNPN